MFDCIPPTRAIIDRAADDPSDQDLAMLELATMFGQISTNLDRALQVYAERAGMTLLDGQALYAVCELGAEARPGTIAERLKMPLSTMTGVANRLVAAGLVERKPAPGDGRSAILEVTDAGLERVKMLFHPVLQDVADILEEHGPGAIEKISEGFRLVLSVTETLEKRVKSVERKN
jgi:DNA-binding MarR family transcriptional regulator